MLKKLFIKDYKNINDPIVRHKYGLVAGIFGIITNFILFVIKLIFGLISGSISIIVDSVNNLSDMTSSIVTLIGFKLVSKKPDRKHPYGHARYEYISGLIISIFMIFTGVIFLKESFLKIINPVRLDINYITFIVLVIAIIFKLFQAVIYNNFSKEINSSSLKASFIDARNDIVVTFSILIGLIFIKLFNINIDGYLALFVSIFIIYSSIKMLTECTDPIIGVKPSEEKVSFIKSLLKSYDIVLGIHDLVIHNYGALNDFVTVHIEVDSTMDMLKAHEKLEEIENDFYLKYNIDLTIHMDPVVVGDSDIDDLRDLISSLVKKFDKDLSIHDFRIVNHKKDNIICFDCVVPFENDYSCEKIIHYLERNINKKNKKYKFRVDIDRPYS